MEKLIIGTRGSRLALVQTEMVKAALVQAFPEIVLDVEIIKTSGDIFKEANLAEIGGKELFTREIDEALFKGEIDIAVHSLKDVPGIISGRQEIAAVLPRADARDALIGGVSLAQLPHGAVVGSASPRRKAQMLHVRPDLGVVNFRGNVPGRVKKVQEKQVDCTFLAMAGLDRLQLNVERHPLSVDEMLPAAGQGIIAIAVRSEDVAIKNILSHINHYESFIAATAERAVLKIYGGNCYTPIAAYAVAENGKLTLKALIASTDGSEIFRDEISGNYDQAEELGIEIGKSLLNNSKDFT